MSNTFSSSWVFSSSQSESDSESVSSGHDYIGFTNLGQENSTRLGFSLNIKSKSLQMSRKRSSEANFKLPILTFLAPI